MYTNQSGKFEVLSPITGKNEVEFVKNISTIEIISNFSKIIPELEVARFFKKDQLLSLYRCKRTDYLFYYPYIVGDGLFYAKLGELPWYYMPWKWEHEQAITYMSKNTNVLEVGAGKGAFIKKLSNDYSCNTVGLELNPNSKLLDLGLNCKLLNETIQNHAISHAGQYDTVCSFQVLEHVPDVKSFIESMVHCLRPGGTLIIGVPNNDTFLAGNPLPSKVLNMPPHHVGLWDKNSLTKIRHIFDLELLEILMEPLQDAQLHTYSAFRIKKFVKSQLIFRILVKFKMINIVAKFVKKEKVIGHTIVAIYRKK